METDNTGGGRRASRVVTAQAKRKIQEIFEDELPSPAEDAQASQFSPEDVLDEDNDNDIDFEEEEYKEPKNKKQKTSSTPKRKKSKVVKIPKRYLTTMFIPSAEILEKIAPLSDDTFTSTSNEVNISSSPITASREAFRAVLTKNYTLLKSIIEDVKHVNCPLISRSADVKQNALLLAMEKSDLEAIKCFVEDKTNSYTRVRPNNNVFELETGEHGNHTYGRGRGTRKLNSSRGGKEGNSALNADDFLYSVEMEDMSLDDTLRHGFHYPFHPTILDYLIAKYSGARELLCGDGLYAACESGQVELAKRLVEMAFKFDGFGINKLHVQVLTLNGEPLSDFKTVSITKKADAKQITPIHMATLNPNTKYLQQFVGEVGWMTLDENKRTLVHFAAVSPSTAALEYLAKMGANFDIPDKKGRTPLMMAAKYNKYENMKVIIRKLLEDEKKKQQDKERAEEEMKAEAQQKTQKTEGQREEEHEEDDEVEDEEGEEREEEEKEEKEEEEDVPKKKKAKKPVSPLDKKDRKGHAAIHHAAKRGHIESIKVLLQNGVNASFAGTGKETPILIACKYGQLKVVDYLQDQGASLFKVDKHNKTCLIHAVKNGHFDLCKYLIQQGCSPNAKDSSGNSVCHYAAAYGWQNIVDLLLQAGADANAINDWKITPLLIAMDKGHSLCAESIMKYYENVNLKDSDGETLLFKTFQRRNAKTLEYAKFLIDKKQADCAVQDVKGNTLYHLLCGKPTSLDIEFAKLIIGKANVNMENREGHVPLGVAYFNNNIPMFHFVLEQGADFEKFKFKNGNLLHCILEHPSRKMDLYFRVILSGLEHRKDKTEILKKLAHETKKFVQKIKKEDKEIEIEHYKTPLQLAIEKFNGYSSLRLQYLDSKLSVQVLVNAVELPDNKSSSHFNPFAEQVNIELPQPMQTEQRELFIVRSSNSNLDVSSFLSNTTYMNQILSEPTSSTSYQTLSFCKFIEDYCNATEFYISQSIDNGLLSRTLISKGNIQLLLLLLLHKLNLNYTDEDEKNHCVPFFLQHFARQRKSDVLLSILLQFGLQIQIPVKELYPLVQLGSCYSLLLLLIDHCSSLKQVDEQERTLLHYAVNGLRRDAYCLQIVELLLKKGFSMSTVDKYGRPPFFYFFVTFEDTEEEQLTMNVSLLDRKDINIHHVDHFKRNLLHYAFANTKLKYENCKYVKALLDKKVDCNSKDIYQRIPFFYMFCSCKEPLLVNQSHVTNSDTKLFYQVIDTSKYKPHVEPTEFCSDMLNLEQQHLHTVDVYGRNLLHYTCAHGFAICTLYLLSKNVDFQLVDYENNSPLGLSLLYNHLNVTIMLLTKGASVNVNVTAKRNMLGKNDTLSLKEEDFSELTEKEKEEKIKELQHQFKETPISTPLIYVALFHHQKSLAYMLIEFGVESTLAAKAALETNNPETILSLLRKSNHNNLIKQNEKNQNLWHILSQFHFKLFYDAIWKLESIDYTVVDKFGNTPLLYASISGATDMARYLIRNKCDLNVQELQYKRTALHYACIHQHVSIIEALVAANAKLNIVDENKYSPILYIAEHKNSKLLTQVISLHRGWDLNIPFPSSQTTILIQFVKENNLEMVQVLCQYKGINVNQQDAKGKTALMYAIKSLKRASYENEKLVTMLLQAGADANCISTHGKSSFYYSVLQKSGKMQSLLTNLVSKSNLETAILKSKEKLQQYEQELNLKNMTNTYTVELNKDYVEARDIREAQIRQWKQSKEYIPPVDEQVDLRNAQVYRKDGIYYTTLLQKTEIEFGSSGINNFYKMQIVFNPQQNIFVLLTRFGRVGEIGNFQQTPFTEEDAVIEFCKIFKQKTGNAWENISEFQVMTGKYKLVEIDPFKVSKDEILKEFDLKTAPPSTLSDPLQEFFKLISNVQYLHKSLHLYGMDDFDVNSLKSEIIEEAKMILRQIQTKIEEMNQINSNPQQGDVKQLRDKFEEITGLSSVYYGLIPNTSFANSAIRPITTSQEVKKKLENLDNLMELQVAARIILAATNRLGEMNPLDYCYAATEAKMKLLPEDCFEHKLIQNYIKASASHVKLQHVFQVARKNEAQRFEKYSHLKHRMLLWHGSSAANFLSILKDGLRIAPPDVPQTGKMFGHGIYFADTFSKSLGYTCYSNSNQYACLLLCQVALGNVKEYYSATEEYVTKAPEGFDSVKGLGKSGPDYTKCITRWDGTLIPNSTSLVDQSKDQQELQNRHLRFNEFIVYDEAQVKIEYIVLVKV